VKAIYPSSIVLAGGLSPATGANNGSMEDVCCRARDSMDGLAIHNYGGGTEPEHDPFDCNELCFRRAERYPALMVELGDAATPIWATEFGWPIDGRRDIGGCNWMKVSPERQADYLVRAYRYAHANWDWMRACCCSTSTTAPLPGTAPIARSTGSRS
jgi:hypothetical protein